MLKGKKKKKRVRAKIRKLELQKSVSVLLLSLQLRHTDARIVYILADPDIAPNNLNYSSTSFAVVYFPYVIRVNCKVLIN